MRWLPYDSWTLESPLKVHRLVARMQERIEPRKWVRKPWSHDHTALQATIHEQGFSARRIIHYRNAFLPILYGKFTPTETGTSIRIRMMPHPLVIGFMACPFGFLAIVGLAGLAAALEDGNWSFPAGVGVMGGLALLLVYGSFFAEADKAKLLISQVFIDVHKEAATRAKR